VRPGRRRDGGRRIRERLNAGKWLWQRWSPTGFHVLAGYLERHRGLVESFQQVCAPEFRPRRCYRPTGAGWIWLREHPGPEEVLR
jgi:hypothetical protein